VDDGEAVRADDQEIEGVDGEEVLGHGLDVSGDQEQGGHHDQPHEHQQLQAAVEGGLHGADAADGAARRREAAAGDGA